MRQKKKLASDFMTEWVMIETEQMSLGMMWKWFGGWHRSRAMDFRYRSLTWLRWRQPVRCGTHTHILRGTSTSVIVCLWQALWQNETCDLLLQSSFIRVIFWCGRRTGVLAKTFSLRFVDRRQHSTRIHWCFPKSNESNESSQLRSDVNELLCLHVYEHIPRRSHSIESKKHLASAGAFAWGCHCTTKIVYKQSISWLVEYVWLVYWTKRMQAKSFRRLIVIAKEIQADDKTPHTRKYRQRPIERVELCLRAACECVRSCVCVCAHMLTRNTLQCKFFV